jgi:hypothetical protein
VKAASAAAGSQYERSLPVDTAKASLSCQQKGVWLYSKFAYQHCTSTLAHTTMGDARTYLAPHRQKMALDCYFLFRNVFGIMNQPHDIRATQLRHHESATRY